MHSKDALCCIGIFSSSHHLSPALQSPEAEGREPTRARGHENTRTSRRVTLIWWCIFTYTVLRTQLGGSSNEWGMNNGRHLAILRNSLKGNFHLFQLTFIGSDGRNTENLVLPYLFGYCFQPFSPTVMSTKQPGKTACKTHINFAARCFRALRLCAFRLPRLWRLCGFVMIIFNKY